MIILAPFGRDAQVIAEVVTGMAPAQPVQVPEQLLAALNEGAAAAVVTEEALSIAPGSPVHLWLSRQPSWSDFPFVVLTSRRTGRRPPNAATSLHLMGNVILLERPLSPDTLHTAVEGGRARRARQMRTGRCWRSWRSRTMRWSGSIASLRTASRVARASSRWPTTGSLNEIAERERAQAALLQVQKMEAMGHLTGGIAHDFNNLLHVIGTNLDLLARLDCPPPAGRIVEGARRTVKRGARLTEQLLSFARNQSLVPQATDIHASINGMQELLLTSVGSRVRIALELAHPKPIVLLDPNQLEMAVLNLALNARDAMKEGGTIAITTQEAECEREGPGRALRAGDGGRQRRRHSAVDHRARVRALLHHEGDGQRHRPGPGAGVRLREAVRRAGEHRGAPGQGTQVHLLFPLATESLAEESEADRSSLVTPRQDILVVEDDDEVRHSIVQSLELLGHQVSAVSNGADALRTLGERRPSLLIVDYVMPGMNGGELIRRVQDAWPTIPIILATGYADMEKVGQVLGARSILKKPFRVDALAEAVHLAVA